MNALVVVAQWIEHWPVDWKDHQFDSSSGQMPGLQARSPVGSIREATHLCFSLTYFFPSLSLSFPLSLNK